jgi:superfamily II DNA or RNA helicase
MEILTSTDVDPKDHEAAMEGYELSSFYNTLEEMLDDRDMREPTKLLCALIATGHLTIKIAVVPRGGIYHDKVGYFQDSSDPPNIVAFSGSGNETYSALRGIGGNVETYNVIWNWHKSWDVHGEKWKQNLDGAMEGRTDGFEVLDFSDIDAIFLTKHSISIDLSEYFVEEEESEQEESLLPPLYPHQKKGLEKWRESGCRGILEHATASGKTITSIAAIEEHVKGGGNAVILVPTRILLGQWYDEVTKYLPRALTGRIGAGYEDTDMLNMMRRRSGSEQFILLSTIRSASSGKTKGMMKRLIDDANAGTLLVVDECHNIGSEGSAELCSSKPLKALGLSATPERMGDQEGTNRTFNLLGPTVHKFSLRDALRHDPTLLTPYEYHIKSIKLTKQEQEKYDELKAKISKLYAIWSSSEEPERSQIKGNMEVLIFKARRIVRGASRKLDAMTEILEKHFREGQHWIIYCDTNRMLSQAEKRIRDIGIVPRIYQSEMNSFNRSQTLSSFKREGGLLLAMKCLDEGVNITCISHGMILSSTTNPREFIQRRGRMLRKSPGKDIAHIFDAFALPNETAENTGFLLSELLRAKELAEDSENRITNVIDINILIRKHGVVSEPALETEIVTND